LDELDVRWPCCLTGVLELPGKAEALARNLMHLIWSWILSTLASKNSSYLRLSHGDLDLLFLSNWFLNLWILADHLNWNVSWVSDLNHGKSERLESFLTLLTQVIVTSDTTLVSNSDNWFNVTAIASDSMVNNLRLLLLFLCQVAHKKLLVLLSAVFRNLILKDLVEILKEFVVEISSALTLFAWKALLVDLLAVASEALWKISIVLDALLLLEEVWLHDEAAYLLFVTNHLLLTSLTLGFGLVGIAHHLLVMSFCLRTDLFANSVSLDILF